MTNFPKITSVAGLIALLTVAGCGSMNAPMNTSSPSTTYYPPATTSGSAYERHGVVHLYFDNATQVILGAEMVGPRV